MSLIALGINHRTAPVELREQVAISGERMAAALHALATLPVVEEAAILSTCNRTELYCLCDGDAPPAIGAWLADFHGLQQEDLSPYLYLRERQLQEVHQVIKGKLLGFSPQLIREALVGEAC